MARMFDFCIGNPPYQTTAENTSDKPIYNFFMDAAYAVAEKVELIHPGRFLFRAGKTPVAWNEKMLNDDHFKVLYYEQDSSKIFPNTAIEGGIAITYRDCKRSFGAVHVFSSFKELNGIIVKIGKKLKGSSVVSDIMYLQNRFNLESLYADFPEFRDIISSEGKERRIVTSSFKKLSVFHHSKQEDDHIKVLGVDNNCRRYRWINNKYIEDNGNLYKFKVLVPKSNGSGPLGKGVTQLIGSPLALAPCVGYTQSFIGIGAFDTETEANSCLKYVKSKFARCLLGIKKITQDNPPEKWVFVPLQDFTSASDIDWSQSVAAIDRQLYKKYGLSPEEIDFIETHVKEMD